jgi:hypothetical protein
MARRNRLIRGPSCATGMVYMRRLPANGLPLTRLSLTASMEPCEWSGADGPAPVPELQRVSGTDPCVRMVIE